MKSSRIKKVTRHLYRTMGCASHSTTFNYFQPHPTTFNHVQPHSTTFNLRRIAGAVGWEDIHATPKEERMINLSHSTQNKRSKRECPVHLSRIPAVGETVYTAQSGRRQDLGVFLWYPIREGGVAWSTLQERARLPS